jgi:3-hydroxybutyryl-CoA dehydrogenase
MNIAILASDINFRDIASLSREITWKRADDFFGLMNILDADAYFNLDENAWFENYEACNKPVFINSVAFTLKESQHRSNVIRLNGWNGFLNRSLWEVTGSLTSEHESIFKLLNITYTLVTDEPGFISARIISMIINEGFFAKAEKISTEDEIDIAMKLGTNYPKGPFEWMREIGIKNVFTLLNILSKTDSRYQPSELLIKEASRS